MSQSPQKASSSFVWPPVIYLTAAVLSGLLAFFSGWTYQPPSMRLPAIAGGGLLIGLGMGVAIAAERVFKTAGTPVPPTRPTTAIVTSGIYRYTRNPMYLGMSLALAGLGLVFDQLWFLLALPAAVFAVTNLAIAREEAYLAVKFGAPYLAYKRQVRRWL